MSPLFTLSELKRHLLETQGAKALEELPRRLERVEKIGTSSQMGQTSKDLLRHNRAGPGETRVKTEEEMLRLYGPTREHPGFTENPLLDLTRPLVIKDPYAYREGISVRVTKIVAEYGDLIFAEATLPDIDGTFPVLFERDGTILTKNFAEMEVVYDDEPANTEN